MPVHPNTARIVISDDEGELALTGISIGGGKIEITELNGFELRLSGNHPAILVVHNDKFGTIAALPMCLRNSPSTSDIWKWRARMSDSLR